MKSFIKIKCPRCVFYKKEKIFEWTLYPYGYKYHDHCCDRDIFPSDISFEFDDRHFLHFRCRRPRINISTGVFNVMGGLNKIWADFDNSSFEEDIDFSGISEESEKRLNDRICYVYNKICSNLEFI